MSQVQITNWDIAFDKHELIVNVIGPIDCKSCLIGNGRFGTEAVDKSHPIFVLYFYLINDFIFYLKL